MKYTICTQPATPNIDSLPVYKIIDYPLEPRDYKPFAQARLCMTPTELMLELWAFEAHPMPESMLRAVFTTRTSDCMVTIDCCSGGSVGCVARTPSGETKLSITSHSMAGEDLQGEYWGATVHLPRSLLEQQLGRGSCHAGSILLGNIYKLSDNPDKPHKGSLFAADFATGREYALHSLAEFEVVSY